MKTFIVLPAILLANQLDFTNDTTVLGLRVAFGVAQGIQLLIAAYLYYVITSKNQQGRVRVPPAAVPSWAGGDETPAPPTEVTVCEYDLSELKKFATQVIMGLAIVSFIHYKWAVMPPLVVQAVLAPFNIWGLQLFQIHVLGKTEANDPKLKRPFPAEQGGLGSLFGMGGGDNNAAAADDTPADEDSQETTANTPSKKAKGGDDKKPSSKKKKKKTATTATKKTKATTTDLQKLD
eukprot:TRINITY_DN1613_c0_g1_i1.p1 TRINITY_DN1613_c0_g1~~TRINITY_DN1613_c0_g1_i1.p1  ORF type:complete len:235 (+),score=68.23 TRINITY_DN1613_c0_g1_i1:46-750(+)